MDFVSEREQGQDRRYMRGNLLVRKKRTRRGIIRLLFIFLFLSSVIVGLAFGFKEGYLYLISSSEYDVRSIRITGCRYSSVEELRSSISFILRRNIFTVDLERIKETLRKNRWVEDASLRRNLPSEIEIEIKERIPVALLLWKEDIYLVDRQAVPIDLRKPEYAGFDFPVLTGAEAETMEGSIERIRTGIEMLEMMKKSRPSMMDLVSEINVSDRQYVQVRLTDGSPVLYLDRETFDENIDHYLSIKEDIAQQFESVDYVDLRWKDRVVVKPTSITR